MILSLGKDLDLLRRSLSFDLQANESQLPKPYLEVSTKFEKFDRLLDRQEALEISNLTGEEFDAILDIAVKVDEIIETEAGARGLIHVDGKKEFALGAGRVPVLVDSRQ